MDLLRELALKGKLIFVAIHQPSSDIYKMFDNMMILDTGGYMIYYGNPVEGVMYFKRLDAQINSDVGECPTCGNVNPELIFNIIEAKVVDEYGRYTPKRKISPPKWEENFKENIKLREVEPVDIPPPSNLSIPSWIKQLKIYTIRDFLSKISNKQYIALNLLEAPILGFILSYIIRYIADPTSDIYIFRENENIPIYIFMALIVALFLGLTVSAEEIFRDRKILKRETFLNLSKSSYLIAKIFILFTISAIQSILFILIANNILGIKGMTFEYWFAMFTTAACANMLGLNVSASFNSAVTIYILIPLLMIPMMVLSGAMFPFDKLNRSIGSVKKVPLIAEIMPTKWSYEALMVNQFKNNEFEKNFFEIEKRESNADFKQVYYIPELEKRLEFIEDNWYKFEEDAEIKKEITDNLKLLKNEIEKEEVHTGLEFESLHQLDTALFNEIILNKTQNYLEQLNSFYSMQFQKANNEKENIIRYLLNTNPDLYRNKRNAYHNESVADQVKKRFEKNKILEYNYELIQQVDPIYKDPDIEGFFNFRSHFFAPRKYFAGKFFDTYWFNLSFVWVFTVFLYLTLYYDVLKKLLDLPGKFKFKK
jgi:ABC-type multidrug transport system permease subunit